MSVAQDPIQCNLKYLTNEKLSNSEIDHLLQHRKVRYWLQQLEEASSRPMFKINGSHDHQYENYMGKLYTLGIRAGMPELDQCVSVYLEFLHEHIKRKRRKGIFLDEIFDNYDYELILATFLALLGYQEDSAIHFVAQKRVQLLYKFVNKNIKSIYVNGRDYPGVCPEWQHMLIDPKLYKDSNIGFPTVYDYHLFAAVYQHLDEAAKEKIDAIISWTFSDTCRGIPKRYGYFYLPNDAKKAKPCCWKFVLPTMQELLESKNHIQEIVQAVFVLSHFKACQTSSWFANLLTYLESFQVSEGKYKFYKTMVTEQAEGFYVFGRHMGLGESRDQSQWLEIESTYWMERIKHNLEQK